MSKKKKENLKRFKQIEDLFEELKKFYYLGQLNFECGESHPSGTPLMSKKKDKKKRKKPSALDLVMKEIERQEKELNLYSNFPPYPQPCPHCGRCPACGKPFNEPIIYYSYQGAIDTSGFCGSVCRSPEWTTVYF